MSEQTLKLHTEIPEEPHARLVEYLDMVQAELEELVHKVVNCEGEDGLPFEDLIEMASLPDAQLDSLFVRQGIVHCWKLPEWRLVPAHFYTDAPGAQLPVSPLRHPPRDSTARAINAA